MPRTGSGTFILPAGNPVISGTVVSSVDFNNTATDIANALTASIAKDGQTAPTNDLQMAGFKHTSVGNATARTQYATAAQIQDGSLTLLGSVAGTDTITATMAPAITAYTTGQRFVFAAAATNTGAATININSLGAKSITRRGATALRAGDILVGAVIVITYDGTNFQLQTPTATATVAEGGTGATGLTDKSLVLGSGSSPLRSLGTAINGQLPIGNTSGDPVLATLTGTTNQVTVTNGAGTITLSLPQNIHTAATPTFGNTTILGTINVTSTATLASATISGTLGVTGNATFSSISSFGPSIGTARVNVAASGASINVMSVEDTSGGSGAQLLMNITRNATQVGGISTTNVATSFLTSSDYRLKNVIGPIEKPLDRLSQLKPITYEFKRALGTLMEGFLAHEAQQVVPQAVTGEKDGDQMQGIDHSHLVPLLVAAVQELTIEVKNIRGRLNQVPNA